MNRKDTDKIKVGDWIRFYLAGKLVIGEVKYLETDILGYTNFLTDQGEAQGRRVIESRDMTRNSQPETHSLPSSLQEISHPIASGPLPQSVSVAHGVIKSDTRIPSLIPKGK